MAGDLGLSQAYGLDALNLLRERVAAQLAAQQQQQFQNQMTLRGQNRADEQMRLGEQMRRDEMEYRRKKDEEAATDRQTRDDFALAELTPPGNIQATNPVYGRLQRIGMLDESQARPAVDVGPLLPGDTGEARDAVKLPTAKQLNTQADNERMAAKDAQTADYQAGMLDLRGQMNDLRSQQITAQANQRATMSPSQSFRAVRDLQKEWTKSVKPVRELNAHVQRMQQGLEAARKGDLNAGSQVVITEFNKILDPASVVRESEYARTPEGVSLLGRLQGAAQRVSQGGPGVPVKDLEQFVNLANQIAQGMQHYSDADKRRISKVAGRYQIDEGDIFDESDLGTGAPAAPAAPSGGIKILSIVPKK